MQAFTPPTIAQFKAQFPRDWPYGAGPETVTNGDIQNAINEGYGLFNGSLWNTSIPLFAASILGDTTLGLDTIANVSSVYGLLPTQAISGPGIPALATITLVGANSIVISAPATASALQVALQVGGASGYTVSEATIAYCYLSAHLMVLSLQASGGLGAPNSFQGAGSSGGGIVASKSVDSVSLSYTLPDFVTKSPALAQYMRTAYGQKYLQMLAPKIPGRRVSIVGGERTVGVPTNNLAFPFPVTP
jgi:hypothetical protein